MPQGREGESVLFMMIPEAEEQRSKLERIYLEYCQLMYAAAQRILRDSKDTEDVVHEAFLKIADILQQIEQVNSPKTRSLILIIVERKAIDLYRKRQKQRVCSLDDGGNYVSATSDVENVPARTDLARAIGCLSDKSRQVLLLKYRWGYTEKEIAQILSMKHGTVKKTLMRSKEKLRIILEQLEKEVPDEDHR